jgi:hypothetical protein
VERLPSVDTGESFAFEICEDGRVAGFVGEEDGTASRRRRQHGTKHTRTRPRHGLDSRPDTRQALLWPCENHRVKRSKVQHLYEL